MTFQKKRRQNWSVLWRLFAAVLSVAPWKPHDRLHGSRKAFSTKIFRGYITKKSVKSYDSTLFCWCTSRTHIRTFLRFHGFPESDRLCTFLIVKGNKYLIIVEIDGIDEGIHQFLPLFVQRRCPACSRKMWGRGTISRSDGSWSCQGACTKI